MRPTFIGLAGPSGAGKTTLVRHITTAYPHITHIRLDGFFKPFDTFPMRGRHVNRETPENIEWDNFYAALCSLRRGEPTEFPLYEKKTGVQCGTEIVSPSPVVFIEGYLLYFDPRIRDLIDIKTFMDVSTEEQYRRKKSRWPEMDDAYFFEVVVPVFEEFGSHGAQFAHHILDGNRSEDELIREFLELERVKSVLSQ